MPRLRLILLALLALAAFVLLLMRSLEPFAWDLAINWTAARAALTGVPLYDREALGAIARSEIAAPEAAQIYLSTYTSYIGPPTTAALMLPLALIPFDIVVPLYRLAVVGAHLAAVALAGLAVPRVGRRIAWGTGLGCVLLWPVITTSIHLGQTTVWALVGLAAAVAAAHRGWWGWVGAGIACAALIKISPGLLLVSCLLAGRWRTLVGATAIALPALVLAWLPGQGRDLATFVLDIAPTLSGGSTYPQNQALGAALARLWADPSSYIDLRTAAPLGPWRYVGLAVAGAGVVTLWRRQRRATWTAEALAAAIPLVLLMGPITWDHYLTWAIIPIMLLAPRLAAQGRRGILMVLILVSLPALPGIGTLATLAIVLAALAYVPAQESTASWFSR